jgi:hypothetical protein
MKKSKITVRIHHTVHTALKVGAARRRVTMSELAESAVRSFLSSSRRPPKRRIKLPVFHSGGHLVNIDDRDALYRAMEE